MRSPAAYGPCTVHHHVKDKVAFGFAPGGAHRVENIPEPVTTDRVVPGMGPAARGRNGSTDLRCVT